MVGLSGSSAGSVPSTLRQSFRSRHPEGIVDCSMVIVPRAAVLLLLDVSVAQLRAFVVLEERHEHPFVLDVGVEVVGSTKTVAEDLFMEVYRACSAGRPENSLQSAVAHLWLGCRVSSAIRIVLTFSGAPRSSFRGVFPDAVTSSCSTAYSARFGVKCLLLLLRSPDSCRAREVILVRLDHRADPTRRVSGSERRSHRKGQGRVDVYKSGIRVRDVALCSVYCADQRVLIPHSAGQLRVLADHLEQAGALLYPSPLREHAKLCRVLSRK